MLTGHAPRTSDEIAFGPGTLRDLKLHVGDRVRVGDAPGREATVVGTALLPASSHTDYDQSAWMTAAGVRAAASARSASSTPNAYEDYVLVRWKPGVKHAAARERRPARRSRRTIELYSQPRRRCRPRS